MIGKFTQFRHGPRSLRMTHHGAVGVVLASALAVLAGCATQPSKLAPTLAPTATSAKQDSPAAVLAQYQALVEKLHSPRLVAKMMLKQAQAKQASGGAIMAALLALRAGDNTTAAAAAAYLIEIKPDAEETWSVALRTALALGNLGQARKAADKAYALGGAQSLALGLDGAVDPWFVYPLAMELAAAHPDDAALQLLLARSALAAGDATAALAAAHAADQFGPGARDADFIGIQALWKLGRRDEALKRAAQSLSDHSHDIGLRVFYANMLAQTGKRRQAYEVLGDAKALAPDAAAVPFGYAMVAASLGDTDIARERLAAILGTGSDSAGAYNLLGDLAAHNKHWGEAFGWYQQIGDPDDLATSRVASLFTLYHWKGAKTALDYLTQLDHGFPGLAPTWVGVQASILDLEGKGEAAWTLLGTALKSYPAVQPLRYQRAMLALRLGKTGDALAALKRLTETAPDNPLYLNAYGYTLTEHSTRYQDAYGYIKRALAAMPHDGAILDSMGWVLYRLGRADEALDYLRRAWHDTGDIAVARHLVAVYVALDRRGDARKVLTSALDKSPKDPQLLRLKHELAKQ